MYIKIAFFLTAPSSQLKEMALGVKYKNGYFLKVIKRNESPEISQLCGILMLGVVLQVPDNIHNTTNINVYMNAVYIVPMRRQWWRWRQRCVNQNSFFFF
ncbi:hypothetical protein V6Z11_A05G259700 [Gossypium hirsutum]